MTRAAQLLLALAGVLVLAALALARRDRSRGPPWRRRLVTAGLGLLAALGCSDRGNAATPPAPPTPSQDRAGLDARIEWQRLQALAEEGDAIASGQRGPYPFDAKGKQRLDARFVATGADLDALVAAGLLDRAEAELLAWRLGKLRGAVARFMTVEEQPVMCYAPMPPRDVARESADRLRERLPILERLVAARALHPRVLAKLLEAAEEDRRALAEAAGATAEQREVLSAAGAALDALATRVTADAALEASECWRRVRTVWAEAEEVASGRRGPYPFDARGKEQLLVALGRAREDVLALAGERLLSAPEAALATEELAALTAGVQAKRPTEALQATCYKPVPFTPDGPSLARLRERLPHLERLASGGVLHPVVVRKLVAAARADLAVVASAEAAAGKGGKGRAEAHATARAVEAALRRVEARLPPEPAR
jgi:hypothetical protein